MPFLNSARVHAAGLPAGSKERIILEFLLQRGIGRANAQPWNAIDRELSRFGIQITQQTFQQGLLKDTREHDIFIGSFDHGRNRGYFLIADIEDAKLMRDWYQRRIDVEQARLTNLKQLAGSVGWAI